MHQPILVVFLTILCLIVMTCIMYKVMPWIFGLDSIFEDVRQEDIDGDLVPYTGVVGVGKEKPTVFLDES